MSSRCTGNCSAGRIPQEWCFTKKLHNRLVMLISYEGFSVSNAEFAKGGSEAGSVYSVGGLEKELIDGFCNKRRHPSCVPTSWCQRLQSWHGQHVLVDLFEMQSLLGMIILLFSNPSDASFPLARYELSKETREFFQNQGKFKAGLQATILASIFELDLLAKFNLIHHLRIGLIYEALLDLVFSPRDPQVRRLLCWFMHVSTNYKFHSERKHFLKF